MIQKTHYYFTTDNFMSDWKDSLEEIKQDARESDTVNEYIKNGYRFYYSSMGGSQGEIAKVDLTNGKEVIRILLSHEHEDFWFDYIALIVGRNTDRLYGQFHDIIWNNNLEIISEVKFYEIGNNRNYNCFGTKQEAIDAHKKHMERLHSRKFDDDIEKNYNLFYYSDFNFLFCF